MCFPFNVRFIDTLSKPSYQSEQLANIFQGIVKKVKETMLVHFDDEELFEEIKSHLGPLINRLIFHVQANDIFHGEVQTQYPFAFEMAKLLEKNYLQFLVLKWNYLKSDIWLCILK